jgi:hypothetical protein
VEVFDVRDELVHHAGKKKGVARIGQMAVDPPPVDQGIGDAEGVAGLFQVSGNGFDNVSGTVHVRTPSNDRPRVVSEKE